MDGGDGARPSGPPYILQCKALHEVWWGHGDTKTLLSHPRAPTTPFKRTSVNSAFLQWWSMRKKNIWKHKQMTNTFDTKIILHNYILN